MAKSIRSLGKADLNTMEDGTKLSRFQGFASSPPLPFLVAAGFLRTPVYVCPSIEHSVLLMSRSVNHSPLLCHSSHFVTKGLLQVTELGCYLFEFLQPGHLRGLGTSFLPP